LDNKFSVYAKHVFARVPKAASHNAITIAFNEQEHAKLMKSKLSNGSSYKAEVRFELKHSYFNVLHQSIDHLHKEVVRRLIPTDSVLYSRKNVEPYDEVIQVDDKMKLDDVQMEALRHILHSSSALPILVAGPFGTGKTRLLARAAYEILRKPYTRVLICAHHQTSVDTFVEYFGEMKVSMIRVIPNKSYHSKTKEKYGRFFRNKFQLSPSDFESTRLVITTFNTISSLYHKVPGRNTGTFFTDILIDEGAMSREPEAIGPLGLAGRSTRIIIAGDHRQVCYMLGSLVHCSTVNLV
jgi:hypothetical protein